MYRTLILPLAAGLAGLAAFGSAQAAPVTGGQTVVEVTADLTALGVTATPSGTATVPGSAPVFVFGITGGDIDASTLAGTIEHEGSGIDLAVDGSVISLTDFIIDTTTSRLTGLVNISGAAGVSDLGRVALFDFDVGSLSDTSDLFDLDDPMLALVFTDVAGAALLPLLGADLTGVTLGVAATAPELADAIPVPGAAILFVTGAGLLAARRKAAASS